MTLPLINGGFPGDHAAKVGSFYVTVAGSVYKRAERHLISIHYFNEAGIEFGMLHVAMDVYQEFDPPRIWDQHFLNTLEWRN